MAEAVGLVLAVVPLVVSAAQHYSEAARSLKAYQEFSEDVEDFSADLNTQRTIFNTTMLLLLAAHTGDDRASEMLQDKRHPTWADPDLDAYLCQRFENCLSGFKDIVTILTNRLVSLENFCQGLESIINEVEKESTLSLRRRIRHIRKKIRFACSRDRSESLMTSLRARTQDFRTLVQQTEQLEGMKQNRELHPLTKIKVARYNAIKGAAESLYEALGSACTKHTHHQAHIGLRPTSKDNAQVSFVVAFKQLTLQTLPSNGEFQPSTQSLWLTVESVISGKIVPANSGSVLGSLQRSQKRDRSPTPEALSHQTKGTKKKQKAVTFRLPTPPPAPQLSLCLVTNSPTKPSHTSLQNLCTHNNFCNHIQRVLGQSNIATDLCIGYLRLDASSRHLMYVNSRMDSILTNTQDTALITLEQFISASHRLSAYGGLVLPQERIRVAKQLATAVLQFHTTHWLEESWGSGDVLVVRPCHNFPQRPATLSDESIESYTNVSIRQCEKQLPAPNNRSNWSPVRNKLLFNLGKMLLELAFQQSFGNWIKEEDIDPSQDAYTEYFTAERMVFQLSAELGPRYAELVRKCIHCDFGHGFDLNEGKLQERFYQDVICELEICERHAKG